MQSALPGMLDWLDTQANQVAADDSGSKAAAGQLQKVPFDIALIRQSAAAPRDELTSVPCHAWNTCERATLLVIMVLTGLRVISARSGRHFGHSGSTRTCIGACNIRRQTCLRIHKLARCHRSHQRIAASVIASTFCSRHRKPRPCPAAAKVFKLLVDRSN